MDATPDVQSLKMILIICAAIISILLLIIGYFINRQIVASGVLSEAVNALKLTVESIKSQNEILGPETKEKLVEHSDQLRDHERRLTKIESQHKIFHKIKETE